MPKHPFLWIDAFTNQKFGGNPCAVVFAADSLTDKQMLTITKEMNLSETAFVIQSKKADFGARYFTPAEEIPLAATRRSPRSARLSNLTKSLSQNCKLKSLSN